MYADLVSEIDASVSKLSLLVETSVSMAKMVIESETQRKELTNCNIFLSIAKVKSILQSTHLSGAKMSWKIDRTNLEDGNHATHPEYLFFAIIAIASNEIFKWGNIDVNIYFKSNQVASALSKVAKVVNGGNSIAALSSVRTAVRNSSESEVVVEQHSEPVSVGMRSNISNSRRMSMPCIRESSKRANFDSFAVPSAMEIFNQDIVGYLHIEFYMYSTVAQAEVMRLKKDNVRLLAIES